MFEELPPKENEPVEQKIVDAIKAGGLENPEAVRLMSEWAAREEARIETISDIPETRQAQIAFERKRAQIFTEAGHPAAAIDALNDAYIIALNEGLEELCEDIKQEESKI
jgi:hypothetical protein